MTKIDIAREAHRELVLRERHFRGTKKINHCLPKHKEKFFLKLEAQTHMKYLNALSVFQVAAKKLTDDEFTLLHKEVYA